MPWAELNEYCERCGEKHENNESEPEKTQPCRIPENAAGYCVMFEKALRATLIPWRLHPPEYCFPHEDCEWDKWRDEECTYHKDTYDQRSKSMLMQHQISEQRQQMWMAGNEEWKRMDRRLPAWSGPNEPKQPERQVLDFLIETYYQHKFPEEVVPDKENYWHATQEKQQKERWFHKIKSAHNLDNLIKMLETTIKWIQAGLPKEPLIGNGKHNSEQMKRIKQYGLRHRTAQTKQQKLKTHPNKIRQYKRRRVQL